MPGRSSHNPVLFVAWINVVVHITGLVFALVGMRPGTPLVELSERRAYLETAPLGWTGGWFVWMLCAILLSAFLAVVARQVTQDKQTATLAVTVCIAGGAIDLLCDALNMALLPSLAARQPFPEELFRTIEEITLLGGAIVANGMYTLATLLVTLVLWRRPGISRLVLPLGLAVFVCGMLLVLAGFLNSPKLVEWSTGPTIGLYCVWTLCIAYTLQPPHPNPSPPGGEGRGEGEPGENTG